MERDAEKRPCSAATTECTDYMRINQGTPARLKGKRPVTGCIQSLMKKAESQPGKVGESSQSTQQHPDAELDVYNQVREPILPYSEGPPTGGPDVEMGAPRPTSADGTP